MMKVKIVKINNVNFYSDPSNVPQLERNSFT